MHNNNDGTIRNVQIDGFRFILAILVLSYHFGIRYFEVRNNATISNEFLPDAFSLYAGFLFLSGFFCHTSNIKKSLIGRLKGIIIPFWICISIILIAMLIANIGISAVDISMNYLIFPMISGKFTYIDGAHWYIVYLLYFYLFSYLLEVIERKINWHFFRVFTLCVLLFACFFFEFLSSANTFFSYIHIFLNKRFFLFLFGMIASSISCFDKKVKYLFFLSISVLLFLILSKISVSTLILTAILFFVLYLCFINKIPAFTFKPIAYLGKKSLWIYLLHEVIGFILIDFFYSKFGLYSVSIILTSVLVVLFAVAVGFIYDFFLNKIRILRIKPNV